MSDNCSIPASCRKTPHKRVIKRRGHGLSYLTSLVYDDDDDFDIGKSVNCTFLFVEYEWELPEDKIPVRRKFILSTIFDQFH